MSDTDDEMMKACREKKKLQLRVSADSEEEEEIIQKQKAIDLQSEKEQQPHSKEKAALSKLDEACAISEINETNVKCHKSSIENKNTFCSKSKINEPENEERLKVTITTNDSQSQFPSSGGFALQHGFSVSSNLTQVKEGFSSNSTDFRNNQNQNNESDNFNKDRPGFHGNNRPFGRGAGRNDYGNSRGNNRESGEFRYGRGRGDRNFRNKFDNRDSQTGGFNNYSSQSNFSQSNIQDIHYYRTNQGIIDDIIKTFTFLDVNKVIEILKIISLSSGITIFELMNELARENIIQKNINDYDKSVKKFNDKIRIFEMVDIRDLLPSHEYIITEYKSKPLIDKDNVVSNIECYCDVSDMRRKISKDINGFYNYLPVACTEQHATSMEDMQNHSDCKYAHNEYEINYHSLMFHTRLCTRKDCKMEERCPNSHGLGEQFRKIYDYRKEENINLTVKLENASSLKSIMISYIDLFPFPTSFSLDSFKVMKCKLSRYCQLDPHLCYNYHDPKERRRPPKLFKLENEICSMVQPEKESVFFPNLCPKGVHCTKIHTRYELMYHADNFRKIRMCTRPKEKGKCIFYQTCYGIHPEEKMARNDNLISSTSLEELKRCFQQKDEQCKRLMNICNKTLRCKNCKKMPMKFEYCQTKCGHLLCKTCVKTMSKDENMNCPLCGKVIEKGSLIKVTLEYDYKPEKILPVDLAE